MTNQQNKKIERENKYDFIRKIRYKVLRGLLPVVATTTLLGALTALPYLCYRAEIGEKRIIEAPYIMSSYKEYSIEQVFRDYDGWRIYRTNETGKLTELKVNGCFDFSKSNPEFNESRRQRMAAKLQNQEEIEKLVNQTSNKISSFNTSGIAIFKDLPVGSKPQIKEVGFKKQIQPTGNWMEDLPDSETPIIYREVHLPQDDRISPGTDAHYEGGSGKSGAHKVYTPISEAQ